jgi:hypothetical protein
MRGRKLRSGSLVALLGALILVLGTGSALADRRPDEVERESPEQGSLLHRAPSKVTIVFRKGTLVPDEKVDVTVLDGCERVLGSGSVAGPGEDAKGPHDVSIPLDETMRNAKPRGRYFVTVEYWLATKDESEGEPADPDEGEPADPDEGEPADQDEGEPADQKETYQYAFRVGLGPRCDAPKPKPDPDPGGNDGDRKKQKRAWGSTSSSAQNNDAGHAGNPNLRTARSTTGSDTTDSTSTDFGSYTSPTLSGDDYANTGSTTPFGEDDFGDPFGESTGNSPLSDPTDPTLYDSEVGQVPEEAEDQTLSAAPADDLEPEPSTLVVALATALLLGVGGGLFLRRTDPAPIRARS